MQRHTRTKQQANLFESGPASFRRVVEQIDGRARTNKDKGDLFEYLVKGFLDTDADCRRRFKHVWLWNEWPRNNGHGDTGVDIVAEDFQNRTFAIQCKYRNNPDGNLNRNELSEFLSELGTRAYDRGIIFSTAKALSKTAEDHLKRLDKPVEYIGFNDLENSSIDWAQFDVSRPAELARKGERREERVFVRGRQPTRSPSQVHHASPQTYHRGQWPEASMWFLLLGIAIVGILIVAGIVLYGPVILATLITWLLVLFHVVAYVLLAAMILGSLFLVFWREPGFGIAAGVAICVLAVVLLSVDGTKAFLVHYLSEVYAGYMFLGGLVAAVIGGIRKHAG